MVEKRPIGGHAPRGAVNAPLGGLGRSRAPRICPRHVLHAKRLQITTNGDLSHRDYPCPRSLKKMCLHNPFAHGSAVGDLGRRYVTKVRYSQFCLLKFDTHVRKTRHATGLTVTRAPHPRPLPRRFAKRPSYVPAGSHARQLVSSSPLVERMPSTPVVQRTDRSTVPLPREGKQRLGRVGEAGG